MFTTIIRNGVLIDGTGAKMRQADLAIEEGRIMEVGNLKNAKAYNDVDAAGNYVSPGFIDINSHADGYYTFFTFPTMDSLVHQGVTTVIGGNCGTSCAPLIQDNVTESLQKWANIEDLNFDWVTFEEFFRAGELLAILLLYAVMKP